MFKALSHFITITKHRHFVLKHCIKAGIPIQGLKHDLSKYSPTEFVQGAKYYVGIKSPNEIEREKKGYSSAWLHHKGRNRHHYEYWMDYNSKTKQMEPVKMPAKYLKEMFCDRVAASKIYQGKNYTEEHPLQYFENAKARIQIHPETGAELEKLLIMLKEKGEDETFRYLRNINDY